MRPTQEQRGLAFLKKAHIVHGDKYQYDKVEYKDTRTKICITCPTHSDFWQTPENHLAGHGCPGCGAAQISLKHTMSTEEFIHRARTIHGDKYRYDKVEYKHALSKVCIVCPIHGEFWQRPSRHLDGQGCPRCAGRCTGTPEERTRQFIEKARTVHGNRYIYDKADYKNGRTKICITCPTHGDFWQTSSNHLNGQGCPKCADEKSGDSQRLGKEEFIQRAQAVHGDRYTIIDDSGAAHKCGYDYSKVVYTNINDKICVICPKHGGFWVRPGNHLNGCGCPKCRQSKLEIATGAVLKDLNIKYIPQHHPKWMGRQRLDFYLPDYNLAIECQGEQHYRPVNFFGGEAGFEACQKRDALKARKCKDHGVRLLYIKYDQDVRAILEDILKESS